MNILNEELNLLTSAGNLGDYCFCEVLHIFLLEKGSKKAYNYFTHINFSEKYKDIHDITKVTSVPISICNNYQLGIIKYSMDVKDFKTTYVSASETNHWNYKDIDIVLDDVFSTKKKFIRDNDPTGGKYHLNIPMEWELYGSNCSGNYYVHELYSKKTFLNIILNEKIIRKIQIKIKEHKIGLKLELDNLSDRIGNVICKFNVEILIVTPIKLGYLRGIEYDLQLKYAHRQERNYTLQIAQEHDGLIYENIVNSNFNLGKIEIEPNQCINTVSVIDNTTNLIIFSQILDYSFYSDYFAQISRTTNVFQITEPRHLVVKGQDQFVNLNAQEMFGELIFFIESKNANDRQQKIYENKLKTHKYLISYYQNEHLKALSDIIEILNCRDLIWDLQEVWVIDPYLSADDIINAILFCPKKNIVVKCLCAFQVLHDNTETKQKYNADTYPNFKKTSLNELSETLQYNKDLKLEYRSIYSGRGIKFHDRYIILKFDLNKTRVWSLGASINSLGKSHSIIQIVNSPEIVYNLFEELWEQTDNDDCIIYKN